MPNWCSTDITIAKIDNNNPAATEALNKFVRTFFDITSGRVFDINGGSTIYIPNGFDECTGNLGDNWDYKRDPKNFVWLGNFANFYGLSEEYRYRGRLEWFDGDDFDEWKSYDQNYFQFSQEDAWSPNVLFWEDIIYQHYSDENGNPLLRVYYQCEEPGDGIYYTNDDEGVYYDDTDVESHFWALITLENANEFKFCKVEENSPFIKWNFKELDETMKNNCDFSYNFSHYIPKRCRLVESDNHETTPSVPVYGDTIKFEVDVYSRINANDNQQIANFANTVLRDEVNICDPINEIKSVVERINDEYDDVVYLDIHQHEYCSIEDVDYKHKKKDE